MIRQYDVVPNPEARRRPTVPYLMVVQSHHLPMATTVVAPLRPVDLAEGHTQIEVQVQVREEPFTVMMAELGHLPSKLLGRAVDNLLDREDDIRRALDRLFTGF